MGKFIPREKLSKKARKTLDRKKRVTWGTLNPTTRKPENPKAYQRKKVQPEEDDLPRVEPFNFIRSFPIPLP